MVSNVKWIYRNTSTVLPSVLCLSSYSVIIPPGHDFFLSILTSGGFKSFILIDFTTFVIIICWSKLQQSWHCEELGQSCCGEEVLTSNNREVCQHQSCQSPGQTVFTALLQPGQGGQLSTKYSVSPLSYQSGGETKNFESCSFSLPRLI